MDNASSRFPPLLARLLGSVDGWVGEKKQKCKREATTNQKKKESEIGEFWGSGKKTKRRNNTYHD